MTRRLMLTALLALSLAVPAFAEEAKPDDIVSFDLSGEDWVATKTAHVTLDVEASVSAANAGTMRADMVKAVGDAAKGDWRLTGFTRAQDQTGLERWSVTFDSRLPEGELSGLADAAKKASKAGMQVTVGDIDFSPTLEETEATRASLRVRLFKEAGDQLTALNAALPGRAYRIAQISFDTAGMPVPFRVLHRPASLNAAAASPPSDTASPMERSQKITLNAHVVYAAAPVVAATAPAAPH